MNDYSTKSSEATCLMSSPIQDRRATISVQ